MKYVGVLLLVAAALLAILAGSPLHLGGWLWPGTFGILVVVGALLIVRGPRRR